LFFWKPTSMRVGDWLGGGQRILLQNLQGQSFQVFVEAIASKPGASWSSP